MSVLDQDNPNYAIWQRAVERVIAARKTFDSTIAGAPERQAAEREHQAARAAYMLVAQQM